MDGSRLLILVIFYNLAINYAALLLFSSKKTCNNIRHLNRGRPPVGCESLEDTQCNNLQHTVTHSNTLQRTAMQLFDSQTI